MGGSWHWDKFGCGWKTSSFPVIKCNDMVTCGFHIYFLLPAKIEKPKETNSLTESIFIYFFHEEQKGIFKLEVYAYGYVEKPYLSASYKSRWLLLYAQEEKQRWGMVRAQKKERKRKKGKGKEKLKSKSVHWWVVKHSVGWQWPILRLFLRKI